MHKVGIVGIGKRTKQFYIPILENLKDFEIVGFKITSLRSLLLFNSCFKSFTFNSTLSNSEFSLESSYKASA